MTTTTTSASRPAPTFDEYMRGTLLVNGVVQLVIFLLVAGLAVSRAAGHVLSAAAVIGIAVGATASSTGLTWISGLYGAASDVRKLGVAAPTPIAGDPLQAARLWRHATLWSVGAAGWALAGGGLVAVALNGRVARFPVVLVTLAGFAGVATLAVGNAARARGVASVGAVPVASVPLRTRAWKHIALPLGTMQGLVNVGMAWVLFHDYGTGGVAGVEPLTDKVALADALIVVVLLVGIFGSAAGSWGAHDAVTGRVTLDDRDTQALGTAPPFGVQGLVYCAIVAFVTFLLTAIALPPHPSLGLVMVTRGVLAGALVAVATGVAYVRGACNESGVA